MCVAVGEIHVKIEGRTAVPGGGNPSRTAPDLQGSRIGGTGGPGIVQLILNGKRSIAGEILGIAGDRVAISPVHPMPAPLSACIRADEGSDCSGVSGSCARDFARLADDS